MRQLRGVARFNAGEIALDDVEGALANGRATAQLSLRQSPEGLEASGRFNIMNTDAATLLGDEGRPAIAGRLGLQAEFEGSGLSPASLIGSLKGAGLLTLEDAQFASLDARAFGAALRAAHHSGPLDVAKIRDVVATVLEGGALALSRGSMAPLTISAGQARIDRMMAPGQGADLVMAGAADLATGAIEARLTLIGPKLEGSTDKTRPEILVSLKGTFGSAKRTVDVSMLTGVLMLRSVERQSREIDTIEAERRDAERREAERKEAERKEAERRAAQARATPASLPTPPAPDETTASAIPAALRRPWQIIAEEPPPARLRAQVRPAARRNRAPSAARRRSRSDPAPGSAA